jgi:glyoxylase I family protein
MRVGIHHLDLVVSSLEASLPLYRELLAMLGYDRSGEIVGERGERVVYLGGEGRVAIGLREAQSAQAHDRYAAGFHHVAFDAASRETVDACLRWARERGLHIENNPGEWPYIPGYYAGFFHDLDGIKLEVVHVPPVEERDDASGGPGG